MDRTRAYWLCQIAGWSLFYAAELVVHPENWAAGELQTTLLTWGLRVALGIGLTHAFRIYAKQRGWAGLSLKRLVLRLAGVALLLGAASRGLEAVPVSLDLLDLVASERAEHTENSTPRVIRLIGNTIMMGAWLTIYFGVHAAWNYRQAEVDRWKLRARAEAARLEALKLQLNPHFFFNSLASVRSLISEAPRRAKKMVARLARLLRETLKAGDEKTVPLREELSTTDTYLQIEKMRFEDRLGWTVDISEAALNASVPFMLVQTLAENAVKHGIAQRREGGNLTIEADVAGAEDVTEGNADRMLRLQVTNPGQLEDGSARGSDTGLKNARERLGLLFGETAKLELAQSGPETVTATTWIPQQTAVQQSGSSRREISEHEETVAGQQEKSGLPGTPGASAHAEDSANAQSMVHLSAGNAPSSSGATSEDTDAGSVAHLWGGSLSYWLCQLAGWGSFMGTIMLLVGLNMDLQWIERLLVIAIVFSIFGGLGIGLTHGFRIYAKKHGWTDLRPRQLAPRAGAAAALLGGTYVLILSPMILYSEDLPTAWAPWLSALVEELAPPIFGFSVLMGVWLAIYFGVHAAWNYRQAEIDRWKLQARAETARLEALKLQLNPHFFFNSLAGVRSLISESPRRAKKVVAQLARLLRRTLQASDKKTVPLEEELSTTETYLQLEKVRFEDRLEWDIDVSEAASGRQVPFMLVQTLVENAVKHGVGQRRAGGTIRVEADAESEASVKGKESLLRLRVTNPGTLDEEAGAEYGSSTGLENARERLRLLFGEEASLKLAQSGTETVAATARIPRPSALDDQFFGDDVPSRASPPAQREEALAHP